MPSGTVTALASGTVSYSVAPADIVVLKWSGVDLAIQPDTREVSADAGTTTFAVSNNGVGSMSWTAGVTSGGSWLAVTSGGSGTNSGTITASFSANSGTQRVGTIHVDAGAAGRMVIEDHLFPLPRLQLAIGGQLQHHGGKGIGLAHGIQPVKGPAYFVTGVSSHD